MEKSIAGGRRPGLTSVFSWRAVFEKLFKSYLLYFKFSDFISRLIV